MVEFSFRQVLGMIASAVIAVVFLYIAISGGGIVESSKKASALVSGSRTAQALEFASIEPRNTGNIRFNDQIDSIEIRQDMVRIEAGREEAKVVTRVGEGFKSEELSSKLEGVSDLCITNNGRIKVGKECSFQRCSRDRCISMDNHAWICRSGVYELERRCPG